MNIYKLLTFHFFLIINIACGGSESFIRISSIDNSQEVKLPIGKINIYNSSIIDTTKLKDNEKIYTYCTDDRSALFIQKNDTTFKALRINKEFENNEGEVHLSILVELHNNKLNKLFLVEIGQGIWYWENKKGKLEITMNKSKFKISSILKSIGFSLSEYIKFDYNETGGYDDVVRFLKLETEFEID